MIKNIVFDFGRVLINFEPKELLEHLFSDPDDRKELHRIVFSSPEWLMLDRGVITQEQAIDRLSNQHPTWRDEIRVVMDNWFPILTPIESSVELIPFFKERGFGLYVISNFHRSAFDYIYSKYEWLQLFDGIVLSCDTKSLKPEPHIYETLLQTQNLTAHECLFIDDALANVEGARQVGMQAVQYTSPIQLRQDLTRILELEHSDLLP